MKKQQFISLLITAFIFVINHTANAFSVVQYTEVDPHEHTSNVMESGKYRVAIKSKKNNRWLKAQGGWRANLLFNHQESDPWELPEECQFIMVNDGGFVSFAAKFDDRRYMAVEIDEDNAPLRIRKSTGINNKVYFKLRVADSDGSYNIGSLKSDGYCYQKDDNSVITNLATFDQVDSEFYIMVLDPFRAYDGVEDFLVVIRSESEREYVGVDTSRNKILTLKEGGPISEGTVDDLDKKHKYRLWADTNDTNGDRYKVWIRNEDTNKFLAVKNSNDYEVRADDGGKSNDNYFWMKRHSNGTYSLLSKESGEFLQVERKTNPDRLKANSSNDNENTTRFRIIDYVDYFRDN